MWMTSQQHSLQRMRCRNGISFAVYLCCMHRYSSWRMPGFLGMCLIGGGYDF